VLQQPTGLLGFLLLRAAASARNCRGGGEILVASGGDGLGDNYLPDLRRQRPGRYLALQEGGEPRLCVLWEENAAVEAGSSTGSRSRPR